MNRKITALLLSVCLLLTACGSGDSQADIDLLPDVSETPAEYNEKNETAENTSEREIAPQPDNEPEELVFSQPEIGGNAILSQDTLNGYTASLEVVNIHSLPENEDGAYIADKAYVRVTLPTDNEVILDLNSGFHYSESKGVWADCAENALKIFELEDKGEKRCLLMVCEAYVKSRDVYKVNFYDITAGMEIYESQRFRKSGSFDLGEYYWWEVSDAFAHKEDTTFTDSKVCCELTFLFDRTEIDFTATEGYSQEPVFGEAEVGGNTVFSEDSLGGYAARLVMTDIVTVPTDELNAYQAIGEIRFTLDDESGSSAYAVLIVDGLWYGQIGCGVWADCTKDAVKLYEIEWKGEKKYVLRGYISYGTENDAYPTYDPDLYHARFYLCDFDAAEGGVLRPYTHGGSEEFFISDSLVYRGENVLYDEKTGTELIFDPDGYKADYVRLGEE